MTKPPKISKQRVVVLSGANGFVGRYCLEELIKLPVKLYATSRSRIRSYPWARVIPVVLDLKNPRTFANLPNRIDVFVHAAALVPLPRREASLHELVAVNAYGTQRMAEEAAARGCKVFIYVSSMSVVGESHRLPLRERDQANPVSDYAVSKLLGEILALRTWSNSRMRVICLRLPHIYGHGEYPGYVLTTFIRRAEKGLPLVVHGHGRILNDYIYVKDVARAIGLAMRSRIAQGVYYIPGACRGVSLKKLAEVVATTFSGGRSRICVDRGKSATGTSRYASGYKANRDMGYKPAYPLSTGMKEYRKYRRKAQTKGQK